MSWMNITDNSTENSSEASIGLNDILKMSACGFFFVAGLPAHFYVIWLIFARAEAGIAPVFFNLNLSICEIGTCFTSLFYILSRWFPSFTRLMNFLLGQGVTGRPMFQCLICVERYLAVVHPVTFLKYKPLRYRVVCSTGTWIFTLGSCFMSFFFTPQGRTHTLFFSVQFLLLLSVQLFCLVAVLRALRQAGPGDRKKEEENNMKKRAFNIILITTANMLIIYVPFITSGLYTILTNESLSTLLGICLSCYVLAGFVHPVLYLYQARKQFCLCSVCN